jgi:hypothetical protein
LELKEMPESNSRKRNHINVSDVWETSLSEEAAPVHKIILLGVKKQLLPKERIHGDKIIRC